MAGNSSEMLNLIHESKALSIWDRNKGPVFWYILGVPGPFYFFLEIMLGKKLSDDLLEKITAILVETKELSARAERLNKLIMHAYESSAVYKQIVDAFVRLIEEKFPADTYHFISGGERRDWLFSIPLARQLGKTHVFLFKDKQVFMEQPVAKGAEGLHIADLINNAASYFDMWLPALKEAGLNCHATACIVSRGPGEKKLEEQKVRVAPLIRIDLAFFEQSCVQGLINQSTLDEIACHFRSPKEWAEKYLIGNAELFDVAHADKKSFERMQSFFAQDPWALREKHAGFFSSMAQAIAARQKTAA